MASQLHISSTMAAAAAPSSSHLRRSSHSLFAKPSHFAAPNKNNRRLRVSCSDGAKNGENKVDRRNMLLGLSGLYGAANLISTPGASALPVPAPPLDKCNPNAFDLNSNSPLDSSCCLSGPTGDSNVKDYVLPTVDPNNLKTRRPTYLMTDDEKTKYNAALSAMRQLPTTNPLSLEAQANIHCAYCNLGYHYDQPDGDQINIQVHNSWIFFAFHRWYMYFYERILGKMCGDPNFALPFWNWDHPRGMTVPRIFTEDPTSALYDPNRNMANMVPTAVMDLTMSGVAQDPATTINNNLILMNSEMIRSNSTVCDFMGMPLRRGTQPNPGAGAVERGSHTAVHVWCGDKTNDGQDMGNFFSAGKDPIFYSHHSNVDRMWALWQHLPSSQLSMTNKEINDPDFLNTSFLFYDENGEMVRVYVRDCVDHVKMGYEYERVDLPWINYKPPAQSALAKAKAKAAKAASNAKPASEVLPIVLDKIVRVVVPKTKKGKADEMLVIEDIAVDTTKVLKFDVFVNDADDDVSAIDKASYAGSYAQLPHKSGGAIVKTTIRLKLTDLYDDMDVEDDDTVLVTLVPRHEGPGVTIGGIKIIENVARAAVSDHLEC